MEHIPQHIPQQMAAFIKSRRKELGLSLEAVASRAGCAKSHIWKLEHGSAKNPSLGMALSLCNALSCSMNSLLGLNVSQPHVSDAELALIQAHRRLFPHIAEKKGPKNG